MLAQRKLAQRKLAQRKLAQRSLPRELPVDVELAEGGANAQAILVDVKAARFTLIAQRTAFAVEVDVRLAGRSIGGRSSIWRSRRRRRRWCGGRGGSRVGRFPACRVPSGGGRGD